MKVELTSYSNVTVEGDELRRWNGWRWQRFKQGEIEVQRVLPTDGLSVGWLEMQNGVQAGRRQGQPTEGLVAE